MQIPEALRTYLLGDATLAALIGDRLYPEVADEDIQTPYVVSHTRLTPGETTMNEGTLIIDAEVFFYCVSRDYDETYEIAERLRILLEVFKGVMGGGSGLQIESGEWLGTEGVPDEGTALLGLRMASAQFLLRYIPA